MAPDQVAGAFADLLGPVGSSPITLYQEDCLKGIPRHLPRSSIDVFVTSPPYNRGVAYGRYDDELPREEYVAWLGRLGGVIARTLSEDGSFFLNIGGSPSDPWLPWDVARGIGRSLVLQNVIHWVKSIAIERGAAGKSAGLDRDLAVGHYKPLKSERFLHGAHEYVFHFSHRGDVKLDRLAVGVPYQDKTNVARWKGRKDVRCRGNTWFLPYPTIRFRASDRPHPATFPVELPERCLRLHGVGRTHQVVDPFLGIGSTAVAAARLGLPFVGFDVDESYLVVAQTRLVAEGAKPKGGVAGTTPPKRTVGVRGRGIK